MEDVQVDGNGDLRCSSCGGKSFTRKRTRRVKVIGAAAGIATVGVAGLAAPLVAKQKLYCQSCGTYNRMGSAKPYRPNALPAAKAATSPRPSSPTRTSGRPAGKSTKSDNILFTLSLFGVSLALFVWAFAAGSVLWAILTGLFMAFSALAFVAFMMERPDAPPTEAREGEVNAP